MNSPARPRLGLLRRIGIGTRLVALVLLPVVALAVVATLLAARDVSSIEELREFRRAADTATRTIQGIDAIQHERHELVDGIELTRSPEVALDIHPDPDRRSDQERRLVERLDTARGHAANGSVQNAIAAYSTVVDLLHADARRTLANAPDTATRQWSESMLSISTALEGQLLEDLAIRTGASSTETVRHHTTSADALDRFTDVASRTVIDRLEALTLSDSWRRLSAARQGSVTRGTTIDGSVWALDARHASATLRTIRFEVAVDGLTQLTDSIADRQTRLLGLAAVAAVFAAVLLASLVLLRRSIVRPLQTLTVAATRLSRGEATEIDDRGRDEIGAVGRALAELSETMHRLWADVDEIQRSLEHGQFDERIETIDLEGDWLRLADTMNATLDTGEQHTSSVQAELRRRTILGELSEAAIRGETSQTITSVLLRTLPRAVRGSHVHLHAHPSGPPRFDLGVPLEPSISALDLPTRAQALAVDLGTTTGIAGLVDFGDGPPAVLVLAFGDEHPQQTEPLLGLVETACRLLAQAHRRQAAEFSASYNLEHDPLTGLRNVTGLRSWFSEHGNVGNWSLVGVHPLRLDDLDSSFGRRSRDIVLSIIAGRLRGIDHAELVVRTDDPEFVLVVPVERAEDAAHDVLELLARPIALEAGQMHVDVTVGVARVEKNVTDALTDVSAAARFSHGRSSEIVTFDESHRSEVRRRTEIAQWLEAAITNGDLRVEFQPVVNARTRRTEGYECLVRGDRDGVAVSPGEFIPIAEETDLILAIGEFTLGEACQALPFLPGDDPYVAINLSPVELSSPGLVERIDQVLATSAVDRRRIVFEVTEGAATSADDIALLERIAELGVRIAIDDFGTGHSNLAQLNALPASILKLDRSLVTPIVDDPGASAIVEKTIEMAHKLGMSVIGEGVETEAELRRLVRLRCDRIQGWLTGRPAPLADLVEVRIDRPPTAIRLAPAVEAES